MHIRPMQSTDLHEVSSVAAAAFVDDMRFRYTNPHAKGHPEHWRLNCLRRLALNTRIPGVHPFVCVTDERDAAWLPSDLQPKPGSAATEVILAYAIWMRVGPADDPAVRAWRQDHTDLTYKISHWLQGWERAYIDFFGLDRSIDLDAERRVRDYYRVTDNFKGLPSYWRLRALATHPSAQRRGAGKELMKWGIDNAREEGVPAVLTASPDGYFLYRSMGFQTVSWSCFDSSGAVEDHRVMILDPQRQAVRDVEPGSEEAWFTFPEPSLKERLPLEVVWKLND